MAPDTASVEWYPNFGAVAEVGRVELGHQIGHPKCFASAMRLGFPAAKIPNTAG
eukprot:CAMPEP_0174368236 /NCGR_PEP_ID=MMETSP0811_2-20130205/88338_1 /TAXON_ID=73025 ORGANISM="Eutreptiella gymnastica-like, Strain CCMP1594" /NCGR_SAMPLE_ID=MMETSP0811_2 /ASSEMBLY_ACC=CAM_ASM_000667 /LENGTH=53 /DNA_ID=CAMNT_0015511549 /DNA_START=96 /DNA_END=257 /DNA_ORIENTATION=-